MAQATVKELRNHIIAHPNHSADSKGVHRLPNGDLVSKAKRGDLVAYCEQLDDAHVQELTIPRNMADAGFILGCMTKGEARKMRKAWRAAGYTKFAAATRTPVNPDHVNAVIESALVSNIELAA